MSSNSKDFPYELFRQMHNDLQTQMMKITQAPATSVANANPTILPGRNPSTYTNSYATKPASTYNTSSQQPAKQLPAEKKTFEQAYREAIERLNAVAGNKTNSPQQQQQQRSQVHLSNKVPSQPSPSRSVVNSNRFTVEPSASAYSAPSSGSSESQYKTTIYNINTINLAELLKSKRNSNESPSNGRGAAGRSGVSSSMGSILNTSQSQSVARVMDESNRYRETFANAYARHLLEQTRSAVEKKTAQPAPQKPVQGDQYSSPSTNLTRISPQSKPLSGHPTGSLPVADVPPKKPRKSPAVNPLILNGRDGAAPTFAEVVSSSGSKTNGNVLMKIDRKTTPGANNSNLPSLDAMMAAHASKSKRASTSSLEKKPIEPRLKPSSIQVNHDELYRHIHNRIIQHTQKLSTPPSLPVQQRPESGKVVTPRQQTVIVSSRSVPVPNIGNRPDLTVIVNKPKISSPAPSHVYGKPTISTPSSTSSTGQSVSPSTSHSYSMGLCTPKQNQNSVMASLAEPPPAHSATPKSPFVPPLTSSPANLLTPRPVPVPAKEIVNFGTKNSNSITPKFSKPASGIASDGILNLDTKVATPPPSTSQNSKPNSGYDDLSSQSSNLYRTSSDRSSILYNNTQKVVKIEKRVNYDAYANTKDSNSNSGTSKYQHNVIWKEQPSIKSEDHPNGSGNINEQKKTLLELLQIANMQQTASHTPGQTKGSPIVGRNAGSVSNVTTTGALQTNHMNQTNQDLYNYRIASKSSSKEKHRKLVDPLAIKPDPDRPPMKRKEPTKRLDLVRRKKPKLARSTDPYLQHGPCYEVAPRLSRCRECGRSAAARSRDAANIFCRFIAFRKLKYNDLGQMEVAGFADPNLDAQKPDTSLWDANLYKVPIDLSVEKSKFLLGQVGYKFCELFHQEKEAYFEHMSQDKTIAWKQAVHGVREMCDVCSTTLFNYHWVCSTCGFVVCIDCYKGRKYSTNNNDTGTRDRDGYTWLHCTNREPHVQEMLMLTQIIPSNSLYKLVRQMHGVCALLEIPLNCECPLSKESLFRKVKDRLEFIYPITIEVVKQPDEGVEQVSDVQDKRLTPAACSSTTKMISITIKNIESILSESDNGTICCKAIFGRELSEEKNPTAQMLKHKEKQSYSFEGFQDEIKIESLEDFIKRDETENAAQQNTESDDLSIKEEKDSEEADERSEPLELSSIKIEDKENSDVKPSLIETKTVDDMNKFTEKDPLERSSENIVQEDINSDESEKKPVVKPVVIKEPITEDSHYSDEQRFKASPKLDWKTFNMIVKQLLKFDKSLNISGLFEKHLDEKYSDSASLVDFTAEFQVQHSNIQSFLNDFLSEFVFLTGQNNTDNLTDDVQIMEYNKYMKKCIEFQNKGERIMNLKESEKLYPNVAHQWLCNGRLLRLLDPLNDNNYNTFHDQWERGQPVMVSYVSNKLDMSLWRPESFIRDFGGEENDLINCLNGKLVRGQKMKVFWEGFERIGYRLMDERDRPMMLKLKDWPPGDDFAEMMPTRFNDLMKSLPLSEYTRREGRLNLASRLNSFFVRPDLGPKMYSAYGSALHPTKGTTNLHLDVSDAVNVMVYVAVPKDVDQSKYIQKVLDAIDSDECDVFTRQRIRDKADLPGALWHIFHAKDADKIRSLLNKIEVERGGSIKPNHDPIHDQKWYLDANLRKRLLQEYNVEGYSIVQCSGDAIFIPAGAPHQVRNLHNCVKVAEDFVSPENIAYCFKLTNEFRHLTNTHSNHEDKLQIKNIIYHTVKDAVSCLTNPLIMTKDKIDLM